MASRIAGITAPIGGDTTKLTKALEGVNKSIRKTQSGLKDVEKLKNLKEAATTTNTTNLGGVSNTVNGYNARSDDDLARTIADKINSMINEDKAVYR